MAPAVTVSSLEEDRNAVADKLEFIDLQIKDHGTTPLDNATADIYIQETNLWKTRLDTIHQDIRRLKPADLDDHKKDYHVLLKSIQTLQQALRGILASNPIPKSSATSTGSATTGSHTQFMKLPKLELHPFHGDYLEWTSFKDSFEAAVHNNTSITKVEKFSYLKTLMRDEAARQIAELALTDANYDVAWKQLHDRYQNQRKIASSILEMFISCPPINGTAKSIKGLIDAANRCDRSLEQLGYKMDDRANLFFVHHTITKLDSHAKDLWGHTLNDNSIPKFKDLCQFLERHATAIEESTPAAKHEDPDTTLSSLRAEKNSTGQKNPYSFKCPLGCQSSHPTYRCDKYSGSTVAERWEIVQNFAMCYNCLKVGHDVSQCFNPVKCKKCNELHHSTLHLDTQA